jgi:hypothetical protein
MKRFAILFGIAAAAAASIPAIGGPAMAQTAVTPAPLPSASATPSASPSLAPQFHGKRGATPPPPGNLQPPRIGLSGVWEIAIQTDTTTNYTHFKLEQSGAALTGQYLDTNGKKYPLTGSVDGKDVHVVVTMPDGSALVFDGSEEGGTDMVGTVTTPKAVVGFTAAYRPKYNWMDNLNPGTGGMGIPNGTPSGVP